MNLDNHYYGTYYISRFAGFTHEEALKIAWAAQTVDECKIGNIKPFKDEIPKDKFILTVTDPLEDKRDFFYVSNSLEEDIYSEDDRITAIRAIWMPFHFLPGNFVGAVSIGGIKHFHGLKITRTPYGGDWSSQDDHDMAMMCRTSTETCNRIIRNAKNQYDSRKDTNPDAALFAVGISMHVLADTWSHQYFVGSSNYYVNNIVQTNVPPTEAKIRILNAAASASLSIHTVDCLGHGMAGYEPDYAYLENYWTIPYWNTKVREADKKITRNNLQGFSDGFSQMLCALRYIRGERGSLRLKKELLLSSDDKAVIEKIKNYVFRYPVKDQRYFWLNLIKWEQLTDGSEFPEYEFYTKKEDIAKIIDFMEMAKLHRESVINFINDHYKGVFTYLKFDSKLDYIFKSKKDAYHAPKDIDKAIMEYYKDFN